MLRGTIDGRPLLLALALAACQPAPAPRGAAPAPDASTGAPTGSATGTSSGVPGGSSQDLPRWPGTLAEARDRILGDLFADRGTEAYQPVDASVFQAFHALATRLVTGDTDVAELAATGGYEAVVVWDAVNDRDVVVVWEAGPATHRGALMVALDPAARPVVLESPHAGFDGNTGPQGADLFVALRARAWMVNTAHRCANAASSPCDGVTTACGGGEVPYRTSDVAHAVDSAFQAWHEGLLDADPALIAVQNHGFGHTPGEPEAYLSDGTPLEASDDALVNRLTAELDAVLPVGAASCNLAQDVDLARFCATVNTQGRHANGSVDACLELPIGASGRFLHVEQSSELRADVGPVHAGLMRDALDAALPR